MAETVRLPHPPETRLRAALRALEQAMEEQRLALAEFRQGLSGLGDAVDGLGRSAARFGDALDGLGRQVDDARHAALRLDRTADLWLKP